MKSIAGKYIRLRVILIGFIFSLFLIGIGAKAVYLQVYCGPWLSQKAARQYEKSFVSHGKRGTIFDSNHREMAVSIDVASIAAYPRKIKDASATANTLGKALNIKQKDLNRKLASNKSFVWIKRHPAPREAMAIKALELNGVDFIPEHKRFYPNRNLAAQVLGFSGLDGHGLEGIEFYYNSYLEGADGRFTILKDAFGRGFNADKKIAGNYRGNNLILTIDGTVQHITEQALEEAVVKHSAQSGMAIVMDPKTGAVLALAHYPHFNPNSFEKFNSKLWRNRCITDQFEPGSTMKIFTASAAIESGACTPNTIFYCEKGSYKIGNDIVHDSKPHGWLSLQQIVKYSSNIGIIKVSETTGSETLYKTLRSFGFDEKTGIDCPGETPGSLAPYNRWSKIDAGAISFGQGISVSALQLITATCAIANNGILMKPYVVQAITDKNGRLIKNSVPREVRRVISAKTAETMKRILLTVTETGGTGVNAALGNYAVCGKTGTAQKIDEKGTYAKGKYIASFIGFAPAEDPETAILVVIDEPRNQHYGSIVAAPAFRKIAYETLNYMNLPARRNKLTARQIDWRIGSDDQRRSAAEYLQTDRARG
ncbi:MAG: cell division protein FtsI (penicillin-binding protein 3) [Desulfobacteraceae bacterium Eth-SRB1]|nr:MAG: cell division protein FtsI (penicillin-binding protein 3) [Desulfobacteraceae bacterium Eth-SRB1]